MRPAVKLGKHVEGPVSEYCSDRISSLPDELLGQILSFLPTRHAVSTSLLSTRWRHLFTLTTCLSFEDAPHYVYMKQNERIETTRRFKEFVDVVLELHQVSLIKKFSLICRNTYDNSDLIRWVSHALQKGIQEVHYELDDQINCVPDGFFMCETLLSLKMIHRRYCNIEVPLSAWLPKLKILHLDHIIFLDFESMERLFSSCELLEELTLKYCQCDTGGYAKHHTGILKVLIIEDWSLPSGTFEINAPNLAYLNYSLNNGVKIVPSWKYSCSLINPELIFKCNAYDDDDEHSAKYEHELLYAAACKATELCHRGHTLELRLRLDEDEQMPDFPSLSSIQIDKCPCSAWENVTSLIDKSPQLETIVFDSCFPGCCDCSDYFRPIGCYCYLLSDLTPSEVPFSCHVQAIEVRDFCGNEHSFSLMGHLLTNASHLKTLTVCIISGVDLEVELDVSKELLLLPRASRECDVEIRFGSSNF